jgi:hypothetical protein
LQKKTDALLNLNHPSIVIVIFLNLFSKPYLKACNSEVGFLFSQRDNTKSLTRAQANVIFKEACKKMRIKVASTHSMQRTALAN